MNKIAFFVTSLNSGGIENYLLRFLQQYQDSITPFVICKSGQFGELEQEYRKIKNITLIKQNLSFLNFGEYRKLKSWLKEQNINAVCDFTGNFAGLVMQYSAKAGIKKRITFYRGSTDRFKTNAIREVYNNWVKGKVLKYATDILSNSQSAFHYFFDDKKDDRFEVIKNGIDAEQFTTDISKSEARTLLGIPQDKVIIGHTGRVHYSKNHKTFIEVAERLISKNNSLHFVLCGKDTDTALEDDIKNKGLMQHFSLLGFRRDIPVVLRAMDLYFFPSVTEGQPNALIEAMIMDLDFAASDIAPNKETVPAKEVPNLRNPLDVEGFVEVISGKLNNRKAENYREWAIRNFDAKEKFREFYNKLKS